MKVYETITVPAKEEKRQVSLSCDFCGTKTTSYDWDTGYYTTNETEIGITIKHSEGNNWPSGGVGEEFKCDMCPECFRNKLVPFLQSIAIQPIEYKDWYC